jgi:hypothetical protein
MLQVSLRNIAFPTLSHSFDPFIHIGLSTELRIEKLMIGTAHCKKTNVAYPLNLGSDIDLLPAVWR